MVNSLNSLKLKAKAEGRGFSSTAPLERSRSVLGDDRATELVVQATENEVGVTTGAEAGDGKATTRERHAVTVLEDVVVLDTERPVLGEAVFEAGTDHAT